MFQNHSSMQYSVSIPDVWSPGVQASAAALPEEVLRAFVRESVRAVTATALLDFAFSSLGLKASLRK